MRTAHDDRCAVLEALAYGDDPRITPADRLRALELLFEVEQRNDLDAILLREVTTLSDDDVRAWWDASMSCTVRVILSGNPDVGARYPGTAGLIKDGVDKG